MLCTCVHVDGVLGQSVRFFIHSPNKYLLSTYCIPGAVTQISEANWGAVSELTTWLGRQMLVALILKKKSKCSPTGRQGLTKYQLGKVSGIGILRQLSGLAPPFALERTSVWRPPQCFLLPSVVLREAPCQHPQSLLQRDIIKL